MEGNQFRTRLRTIETNEMVQPCRVVTLSGNAPFPMIWYRSVEIVVNLEVPNLQNIHEMV